MAIGSIECPGEGGESMKQSGKNGSARAPSRKGEANDVRARSLVRDLRSLRRLAGQLHRRAATADEHRIRAIMGKREALLDAIRDRIESADNASDAESFAMQLEVNAAEKETLAETVREIAVLDSAAEKILRDRAEELGADIRKLKAGKKSRESYRQWT